MLSSIRTGPRRAAAAAAALLLSLESPAQTLPSWNPSSPSTSPFARYGHALAYDSARRLAVLFGGLAAAPMGDTWEWDGSTWIRRTPSYSPSPRYGHAMVHDPARRRTVLYGGYSGTYPTETAEWDGTSWMLSYPPGSYSYGRIGHGMVYDSRRGRTVLFGGYYLYGTLGDTREYDGGSWILRASTGPPARMYHSLAYDASRGRVVLFGGQTASGVLFDDTWEWDGSAWSQVVPQVRPSARSGHTLAYDEFRGRTVLFGGSTGSAETWEWDGASWTLLSFAPSPSPRASHAMTYARGRGLLFGGIGPPPATPMNDTWELFPPLCFSAGPGHPTGGRTLNCEGPARVGTTFCVSFSNPTGVGYGLLFIAAGPGLNPPLVLHPPAGVCFPALIHLLPQAVLPGYGEPARFCIGLPANPILAGEVFILQGAGLEPGGCVRLTDGVRVLVLP